ncbi:unnamed protein product [Thelazia callipaeda]|uniref:DUF1738 domain-containing protein n=1 Tax=Thelazia callipaeda TaxID=103827 RepID=A0A0N5CPI2_THECL|nr:unnamed protein product [Thelazia callipaeda]
MEKIQFYRSKLETKEVSCGMKQNEWNNCSGQYPISYFRRAASQLIKKNQITIDSDLRSGDITDLSNIANIDGYYNDHCYLQVETWEQLKAKMENNILANKDEKSFKWLEAKNIKRLPLSKQLVCGRKWELSQHWEKRTTDEEEQVLFKFEKVSFFIEITVFSNIFPGFLFPIP